MLLPLKNQIQRTLIYDYGNKKWSNATDLEFESNKARNPLMMTIASQIYLLINFNETYTFDSQSLKWKSFQQNIIQEDLLGNTTSLNVFRF